LQRGKNAFDRGEFGRAADTIRPLLYPEIRVQSEAQIVQARRILGVAYLFEKREKEATEEFRKLLQLVPDYRFDPLLDPPEVVDFFNLVRKGYETELAALESMRSDAERARQRDREECEKVRGGPLVIERRVGRNAFALNFLPFGAGQFQNGQRKKAWAFLTAESVLCAVSVGAFATNLALYGFRPQRTCRYNMGGTACSPENIDHTDEDRSREITRLQVTSGALFFGVVAWGILDAIVHFQPETQLAITEPGSGAKAARTLRLSPSVLDHAVGPGLSFRF
jgi:hypothetical protein